MDSMHNSSAVSSFAAGTPAAKEHGVRLFDRRFDLQQLLLCARYRQNVLCRDGISQPRALNE